MTILPTQERGRTDVLLDTMCACPRCGTFTMFYRNIWGETYCYVCAPNEEELCH